MKCVEDVGVWADFTPGPSPTGEGNQNQSQSQAFAQRHTARPAALLPVGVGGEGRAIYAMRFRTHQIASVSSATASATTIAASIPWKSQNRSAGW
jgi:hypothetical protein